MLSSTLFLYKGQNFTIKSLEELDGLLRENPPFLHVIGNRDFKERQEQEGNQEDFPSHRHVMMSN